MALVRFNRDRHFRYDGELASFLARKFDRKDLFVVRHRSTGRWSICMEVNPGSGLFHELYGLATLGDFTRGDVLALEAMLTPRPMKRSELLQQIRDQHSDEYRAHQDGEDEAHEAKKFLARKLGIDHPLMTTPGGFPLAI
jgi:hypothetical protein